MCDLVPYLRRKTEQKTAVAIVSVSWTNGNADRQIQCMHWQ